MSGGSYIIIAVALIWGLLNVLLCYKEMGRLQSRINHPCPFNGSFSCRLAQLRHYGRKIALDILLALHVEKALLALNKALRWAQKKRG